MLRPISICMVYLQEPNRNQFFLQLQVYLVHMHKLMQVFSSSTEPSPPIFIGMFQYPERLDLFILHFGKIP